MTVHDPALAPTFPSAARDIFAANYPEIPHKLTHRLSTDARLSLEGLAALAEKLLRDACRGRGIRIPGYCEQLLVTAFYSTGVDGR